MDTHVAPSPEIGDHEPVLSARLPGEPDPDTGFASETTGRTEKLAPDPAPLPRRKRRAGLLSGIAIVGLLALGGGAFVLSPYNHLIPIPRRVSSSFHDLAASAGLNLDRPFAPSASLASVKLPPKPSAVVAQRYVAKPPDQDLREVLAMRSGATPPDAPAAPVAPPRKPVKPVAATAAVTPTVALPNPVAGGPADYVPHEPGATIAVASKPPGVPTPEPASTAGPAPHDITQAVVTAATGRAEPAPKESPAGGTADTDRGPPAAQPTPHAEAIAATQEPQKPPAPVAVATTAASPDAVTQALHLRAEPMSNKDQVQVLELVTQMAAMVRDLKSQNASLRADFAKTTADDDARLADFERRIDLAEARTAVAAAVSPGGPPAVTSSPAPATILPVMAASSIAVTRPEAALPSTTPTDTKRYRVQAASPGLALLTEVARGGGDGAQIQVTVGDTIPGWGKVKSVSQLGTAWVVSTEHGVIR